MHLIITHDSILVFIVAFGDNLSAYKRMLIINKEMHQENSRQTITGDHITYVIAPGDLPVGHRVVEEDSETEDPDSP